MIATRQQLPQIWRRQPHLVFSPLAWLKLQYFCHSGDTEIGGFGVTSKNDQLYVEDFVTVRQQTTAVTVSFADEAVADFMDRCVDAGLAPQNFLRVWCHTHPGSSAEPSSVDEDTFARVFGSCDWAVMFILSRAGSTFARLSFHVGPGASVPLPVSVDWSAWPNLLNNPQLALAKVAGEWQTEFAANIKSLPPAFPTLTPLPDSSNGPGLVELFAKPADWTEIDEQIWEDYQLHERYYDF